MSSNKLANLSSSTDQDVDLVSAALTVAENLPLLIGGSILAGLIAFSASIFMPDRFVSKAIIDPALELPFEGDESGMLELQNQFAKRIPAILTSTEAVNAALKVTGISVERLSSDVVRTRIDRNDGLITLSVTASSPIQAQKLAYALIATAEEASKPKAVEMARLVAEHERLLAKLQHLEKTAQKLRAALEQSTNLTETGSLANGLAGIQSSLLLIQQRADINLGMQKGLSRHSVIQAPSLPANANGPTDLVWAAIASTGSLSVLLIWVFLRQAWGSAQISEEHRDRILLLRKKYRLKS